jgi:glycosyltransferase involved in cell wall biosynthesis
MRILLLMDPFIPVPPQHYGGIERVIADLAETLHARGHEVSLWAGPGSHAPADVRTFGHVGEWSRWSNIRNTAVVTGRLYAHSGAFDVVHNFGRLAYLAGVLPWSMTKVQTYMRPVNPNNMRKVRALGARNLRFTAVSRAIRDTGAPGGGDWEVVYNGASPGRYVCRTDVDPERAALVFLGRLERCKGAHTAIDVATRLGRPLIIAGNISTLPHERAYFDQELQPRIDGRLVQYIGTVDDAQKNALLGSAAALLTPIEWDEPFPVVLPEAMLCGTPVIAFRRGGTPEGIDDGRTGFVCDTLDEMVAAVRKLGQIQRGVCRAEAERRFSVDVIADDYERVYRSAGAAN